MHYCQTKRGEDYFIYLYSHPVHNVKDDSILDIGYVHFYPGESEVTLLYLYVKPDYRNQNVGTNLMIEFFKFIRNHYPHRERITIKLDDVSDRYNKPDNIYKKFGFNYCEIDEEGPCGPEMELTITF